MGFLGITFLLLCKRRNKGLCLRYSYPGHLVEWEVIERSYRGSETFHPVRITFKTSAFQVQSGSWISQHLSALRLDWSPRPWNFLFWVFTLSFTIAKEGFIPPICHLLWQWWTREVSLEKTRREDRRVVQTLSLLQGKNSLNIYLIRLLWALKWRLRTGSPRKWALRTCCCYHHWHFWTVCSKDCAISLNSHSLRKQLLAEIISSEGIGGYLSKSLIQVQVWVWLTFLKDQIFQKSPDNKN